MNLYQLLQLLHDKARLVTLAARLLSECGTSRMQRKSYAKLHSRIFQLWDELPRGQTTFFGKTDMVCCKRLLYMVGFLRPPTTTSGWTTFRICYCNSEIQDGVQDGRHILKFPYYHQLSLYRYFHVQYIV